MWQRLLRRTGRGGWRRSVAGARQLTKRRLLPRKEHGDDEVRYSACSAVLEGLVPWSFLASMPWSRQQAAAVSSMAVAKKGATCNVLRGGPCSPVLGVVLKLQCSSHQALMQVAQIRLGPAAGRHSIYLRGTICHVGLYRLISYRCGSGLRLRAACVVFRCWTKLPRNPVFAQV